MSCGRPETRSPKSYGHYHGTPRIEREIVYVVQTDRGQETLTPDGFTAKYGWKNDPERVRMSRD